MHQKLKGKLQQIRGEIEIAAGKRVKGNINKLKGKANEALADAKMKSGNQDD